MQGKFSDYLLVSDMDATLLDDNHTISEENRQAIDYFIKNGGRFTVATGRMVEADSCIYAEFAHKCTGGIT